MDGIKIETTAISHACGVGKLGAISDMRYPDSSHLAAQLDMAERRILRLEMALRRAGIEVEQLDLPA